MIETSGTEEMRGDKIEVRFKNVGGDDCYLTFDEVPSHRVTKMIVRGCPHFQCQCGWRAKGPNAEVVAHIAKVIVQADAITAYAAKASYLPAWSMFNHLMTAANETEDSLSIERLTSGLLISQKNRDLIEERIEDAVGYLRGSLWSLNGAAFTQRGNFDEALEVIKLHCLDPQYTSINFDRADRADQILVVAQKLEEKRSREDEMLRRALQTD